MVAIWYSFNPPGRSSRHGRRNGAISAAFHLSLAKGDEELRRAVIGRALRHSNLDFRREAWRRALSQADLASLTEHHHLRRRHVGLNTTTG